MKWLNIYYDSKKGNKMHYKGRVVLISSFEKPGNWVLYKGKEHLVEGWFASKYGVIGLILNPQDDYMAKIILRKDVEIL